MLSLVEHDENLINSGMGHDKMVQANLNNLKSEVFISNHQQF